MDFDNFSFKLNPHTFVRDFGNCIYMENQVNHVKGYFNGWAYPLTRNIFHSYTTFSFWNDYWLQPFDRGNYGAWISEDLRAKFLYWLNEMWFIDIIDTYGAKTGGDFSYKCADEVEAKFTGKMCGSPANLHTDTPWLQRLQINITDACNERCTHCYLPVPKKDRATAIPTDTVIDLLKQFRKMNGLKVVLSGGEIFMYRNLFAILDECRKQDLMILLQSNMATATPDDIARLKTLDLFNIQVSLYSTDETVHDSITRCYGSCRKTMANIKELVINDIPATISCPVTQANFASVEQLREWAANLGLNVHFDYVVMAQCDGSDGNIGNRLTSIQARKLIDMEVRSKPVFVDAIGKARSLDDLLSSPIGLRRQGCSILADSMCIDSDGLAYPCPGWNGMKIGNTATKPLQEIWANSAAATRLRETEKDDFVQCRECKLQNFCNMCPTYNYNENGGDMFKPCPSFCENARLLRQSLIDQYNELHATKP